MTVSVRAGVRVSVKVGVSSRVMFRVNCIPRMRAAPV